MAPKTASFVTTIAASRLLTFIRSLTWRFWYFCWLQIAFSQCHGGVVHDLDEHHYGEACELSQAATGVVREQTWGSGATMRRDVLQNLLQSFGKLPQPCLRNAKSLFIQRQLLLNPFPNTIR
jgi:hypothetical protein